MWKDKDFNLDFYLAIKVVMEGKCVQGDNFRDGIFMKLDNQGRLVTVDAMRLYAEERDVQLKGMLRQNFRQVDILTPKALSY